MTEYIPTGIDFELDFIAGGWGITPGGVGSIGGHRDKWPPYGGTDYLKGWGGISKDVLVGAKPGSIGRPIDGDGGSAGIGDPGSEG